MKIIECEQNSPEWLISRCGLITASHIADVIAKLKRSDGEAACRRDYKYQLAVERLTGLTTETYVSAAMEWGTSTEPLASAAYEIARDVMVDRVGLVLHDKSDWFAASPDGLVGDDGLVEIKCPNSTTHIQYILADVVPSEYKPQMLWQMACTGRQWCDFVSYDPRMPEHLQLFIKRFPRDDKAIADMEAEAERFDGEVRELIAQLPTKSGVSALQHNLTRSLGITEADIAAV